VVIVDVDQHDKESYLTPKGPQKFEHHSEKIKVKDAPDAVLAPPDLEVPQGNGVTDILTTEILPSHRRMWPELCARMVGGVHRAVPDAHQPLRARASCRIFAARFLVGVFAVQSQRGWRAGKGRETGGGGQKLSAVQGGQYCVHLTSRSYQAGEALACREPWSGPLARHAGQEPAANRGEGKGLHGGLCITLLSVSFRRSNNDLQTIACRR
jgi:hypothetical protein